MESSWREEEDDGLGSPFGALQLDQNQGGSDGEESLALGFGKEKRAAGIVEHEQ